MHLVLHHPVFHSSIPGGRCRPSLLGQARAWRVRHKTHAHSGSSERLSKALRSVDAVADLHLSMSSDETFGTRKALLEFAVPGAFSRLNRHAYLTEVS